MFRKLVLPTLTFWVLSLANFAQATPAHTIDATFDPAATRLLVSVVLALPPGTKGKAAVTLSPAARDLAVTANQERVRFSRSGDRLALRLPPGAATLTLSYSLPLDAPPKDLPPTQDNPGALSSDAVCGPDWAMLMPGSLWHPEFAGAPNSFRVRIHAPPGVTAVTQGKLEGIDHQPDRTDTIWDAPRPVGRLGLCLARYQFTENRDSPAQAFLLEGSSRLSPVYLSASAKHMAFYAALHGPYAFEKFAVAENPLPTGYGFPSYTLLGSQVLALPFIPATSLRHEIAHSWWGNGVLVDSSQGNWCEGLTTYVADYLSQEEDSPKAARAYRLRTLRSFAELAGKGNDFPLSRFGSRFSPASQAVGYGKALFVFHMLRSFVGDEAFWQGLRRLYADRLFQPATWEDIRKTFAGLPGFDEAASRAFFSQWLTRMGGPSLKLAAVSSRSNASGGHAVTVTVSQTGKPYLLKLALRVDTEAGPASTTFVMDGPTATVTLDAPGKPLRAILDPEADCFRLLAPSEVPPSVNSLKAARSLTVVLADDAPESLRAALPRLLAGLGHESATVLPESSLAKSKRSPGDLLVAGRPRASLPEWRDLAADHPEADTLLVVLPGPGGFTALFQARPDADARAVAAAAAKVTHYGTYGLLGFKEGTNVLKDAPEPEGSPLVKQF